tara:strand:+ start:514 stop:738 length:225 start_codon:yes stop_codon:yes gene_type:complete
MIRWTEKEEISWLPPLRDRDHGWLNIEGELWLITKWHHFDDFGQTIETVTAKKGDTEIEVYSMDEGLTWHTELD